MKHRQDEYIYTERIKERSWNKISINKQLGDKGCEGAGSGRGRGTGRG